MKENVIEALERLEADDWDAAHDRIKNDPSPEAAWCHAHLHRLEGDEGNAAYWYRRAGRMPFEGTEEAERAALREAVAE